MTDPVIIQGGMGAAVSNWRLARTVSQQGQLGVVSGTALDSIQVRILQAGDPGDHVRRALAHFPFPEIAQKFENKFYIPGGKPKDQPFTRLPFYGLNPTIQQQQYAVLANFVEVWLAKEGHDGLVGINLLEKIQVPNLASLYGAVLAGVDYVLMGAGIPWEIPGILDNLSQHKPASMAIAVEETKSGEQHRMVIKPNELFGEDLPSVGRPKFLAIISSATLAQALLKRATGKIDGFVVEAPTAGGHNAPPRGPMKLTDRGEPAYGPRDEVDFGQIAKLGLPFWLAGSCGSPERLKYALEVGGTGIQVGTLFAFCQESGLDPNLRQQVIEACSKNEIAVFTDPLGSPTGFPFKVVELPGTLSENDAYLERPRICDLGYLRKAYQKEDGSIGYRCPSEPVEEFVKKGGELEETVGRKCLCNALVANIGLEQQQKSGYRELPLLTAGNDLAILKPFLDLKGQTYSSKDVLDYLLERDA